MSDIHWVQLLLKYLNWGHLTVTDQRKKDGTTEQQIDNDTEGTIERTPFEEAQNPVSSF